MARSNKEICAEAIAMVAGMTSTKFYKMVYSSGNSPEEVLAALKNPRQATLDWEGEKDQCLICNAKRGCSSVTGTGSFPEREGYIPDGDDEALYNVEEVLYVNESRGQHWDGSDSSD